MEYRNVFKEWVCSVIGKESAISIVLHGGFFGLFKCLGFFQTLANFFWNARFCGSLQKILKGCFIFGRGAFKEVDQRKRYKTVRNVGKLCLVEVRRPDTVIEKIVDNLEGEPEMRSEFPACFDSICIESGDHGSDLCAGFNESCGFPFNNRIVLDERKVHVASVVQFKDFSDDQAVGCCREHQGNVAGFFIDDAAHGLRKNVISDEHGDLVAPFDVGCSLATTHGCFVDNVVVDKACQMQKFNACASVGNARFVCRFVT